MRVVCSVLILLASLAESRAQEVLSTDLFSPGSKLATVQFEGELAFDFSDAHIKQLSHVDFLPDGAPALPILAVTLIADGQDLIPVSRGLRTTDDPVWDYFISPGKSWQEGSASLASLPLTLIYRPTGCTHNGLIRFRYSATEVTDARILMGQETCHFLRADISGRGKVTYRQSKLSETNEIRTAWRTEKRARLRTFSLDEFAVDHPAVDIDLFKTGLPTDHDLSTFGFYYMGKHYNAGCMTRHGPYPYCEQMLMTSFSTAKTAYAAIALMTMAQEFGDEVYDATILSLLPEAEKAKGRWHDVTLNHIGDMASGNFSNSSPMADPGPGSFYMDLDRDAKLAAAFLWPNAKPAGEQFVYQTADTFIQINAMDAYLQKQHTDFTDSFDYLVARVLSPLTVQPEVWFSRRTRDDGTANSGTAFGGMGMWWTADAIVKVARLMLLDDGVIDGKQVLHPMALSSTMQRNSQDRGMQMGFRGYMYNNNTWALPVRDLGEQFSCDPYVTLMSGLSGVRVFMMPNGLIFYYFNDAQAFPTIEAILAADKLEAVCKADS